LLCLKSGKEKEDGKEEKGKIERMKERRMVIQVERCWYMEVLNMEDV
jgi:hypothetical protein